MTVRVFIKSLGYGGVFVGEVVAAGVAPDPRVGKKVLVREVAPGETVDVEIIKEAPKFILGRAVRIEAPCADRTPPPCPKYGVCGGCDLQHLTLSVQRRLKTEMVRTMLGVQGKLHPTHGVTLLGDELPGLYYRRRVQLHLARSGALGFYRAGTTDVVDIERCFLADDAINLALQKIRSLAVRLAPVIEMVIIEHHGEESVVVLRVREEFEPRRQAAVFDEMLLAVKPLIPNLIVRRRSETLVRQRRGEQIEAPDTTDSAGHFSQVNERANGVLVQTVLGLVDGNEVTDLYAGAGNFALPLARAGKSVTAVELDPALVLAGTKAARDAGLELRYHPLPCETFVERHSLGGCVVLDPPRAGAKEVVRHFDPKTTTQIIYVSCDLPSLTRDLKTLVERGYVFERLFVVDMFPQTHHVETVAVLRGA
ncbi:MAG: hypothetical protein RL417_2576 [Pseudomonadota bacterium]|jgi:23S rRNA (uracil1939-C5)-methyltransferase